ncbi:unnamed protein product [Meganyctiphanes norvegica]|uniref:Uncharacterized protein n=1 Tax=Meganyctiphanes norvegica TaxID=48144 RepID=A0AAV2RE19_MEGNR
MMQMSPTTQLPPTPGSVGSRSSTGGGRTPPSHSPPPTHHTTWPFDDQVKQGSDGEEHVSDMDQDEHSSRGGGGGRESPLRTPGGCSLVEGEDILAKLKQQVNAASLFNHARENLNSPPRTTSPTNNNNNSNGHNLYDRLHSLLQVKMKKEDGSGDEDSRDLVLRAEALQRHRETLLTSPQVLMNAMRGGGLPTMVPPGGPHFLGLLPTPAKPPTPGSAGSRESSSGGGGARTPSHTPELHQGHQSWGFDDHFKQVGNSVGNTSITSFQDQIKQVRKVLMDSVY